MGKGANLGNCGGEKTGGTAVEALGGAGNGLGEVGLEKGEEGKADGRLALSWEGEAGGLGNLPSISWGRPRGRRHQHGGCFHHG